VATGATFVAEEVGVTLESVKPEMLGFAEKVVVGKDTTTIVTDSEFADSIKERIAVRSSREARHHHHLIITIGACVTVHLGTWCEGVSGPHASLFCRSRRRSSARRS
jgi:hypothetical protein